MSPCVSRSLPLLALFLALAVPVRADLSLGGTARAIAMGGAGLASGESPEGAALNPANLADAGARLGIEWPTVQTRMTGGRYTNAFKLVGSPVLRAGDAASFATGLGRDDVTLDASGSVGLLLPKSDLRANAALRVKVLPNASFEHWVQTGGTMPADAHVDTVGVGMANWPSFGMGFYLPSDPYVSGLVGMGVRFKRTSVYYTHYTMNAAGGTSSVLAPEMAGRDFHRATSFSADLGFTYMPPGTDHLRFAFVIDNLVQPKALDVASAFLPADRQVLPRAYSLGSAYIDTNLTLAADWVDIRGARDRPQLRLGVEARLPRAWALRGGYNTKYGFSVGLGWESIGIAYSERAPLLLSQSFAF
jgi:hypothetical protein